MELQSAEITEIAKALCKAQAEMGPARKGAKNPHFKSSYADLSTCIEAVRGPFTENGLCFFQAAVPCEADSHMDIVTTIMHESGQWIRSTYRTPLANRGKTDAQSIGSAITYAKRYSLSAIAGLATEDDDGNAASRQRMPPKPVNNATAGQMARLKIACAAGNITDDKKVEMMNNFGLDFSMPRLDIEKIICAIEAEYGADK